MPDPLDTAVERLREELNEYVLSDHQPLVVAATAVLAALDAQPPTRTEGEGRDLDLAAAHYLLDGVAHGKQIVPEVAEAVALRLHDRFIAARPAPPEPEPGERHVCTYECAGSGHEYGDPPRRWMCVGEDVDGVAECSPDNRIHPLNTCGWDDDVEHVTTPAAPAPVPEEQREEALTAEEAWRTADHADPEAGTPCEVWWDSHKDAWMDGYETALSSALSSPPAAPGGGEAGTPWCEVCGEALLLVDGVLAHRWYSGRYDHAPAARSAAPGEQYEPTQADVLAWVAERWPDRTDTLWRAAKLCEEAGEVMGAVIKMDEGRKTLADLRQETAQVTICAMGVAEAAGFDLWPAVTEEWHRCSPARRLPAPETSEGDPT